MVICKCNSKCFCYSGYIMIWINSFYIDYKKIKINWFENLGL